MTEFVSKQETYWRVVNDHEADLVFKNACKNAEMFEMVEHENGMRGSMKVPPDLIDMLEADPELFKTFVKEFVDPIARDPHGIHAKDSEG